MCHACESIISISTFGENHISGLRGENLNFLFEYAGIKGLPLDYYAEKWGGFLVKNDLDKCYYLLSLDGVSNIVEFCSVNFCPWCGRSLKK